LRQNTGHEKGRISISSRANIRWQNTGHEKRQNLLEFGQISGDKKRTGHEKGRISTRSMANIRRCRILDMRKGRISTRSMANIRRQGGRNWDRRTVEYLRTEKHKKMVRIALHTVQEHSAGVRQNILKEDGELFGIMTMEIFFFLNCFLVEQKSLLFYILLCRPSEDSLQGSAIPDGSPSKEWQSTVGWGDCWI
jgi:hypothetical protein